MEIKVKVNGIDHRAEAQMIQGTLWVHHNGRTFASEQATGRKSRKRAGAGGSSDQIAAPMPGKITKILLKNGDHVKIGQAVLVMEAMKMEYTLKSEIEGNIEAIECAVGEQVVLGKMLVKMKAAEKA
jgi:acetyl/propionyl-CoA carboxylase alpha subunit